MMDMPFPSTYGHFPAGRPGVDKPIAGWFEPGAFSAQARDIGDDPVFHGFAESAAKAVISLSGTGGV